MSFLAILLAAVMLTMPVSSQRNTTYHNPVLLGWHSDPSCTFVSEFDNTFFCTTSSFLAFPGCPVFASKDLVNWRLISHANNRPTQIPELATANANQQEGTWASTIRFHNGTFYLITAYISFAVWNPEILIFTTTNPFDETTWSDPLRVPNPEVQIDPDIFFDDDGSVYVSVAGGMFISQLDLKTGNITTPVATWNGTGNRNPEGPHLYKKDGFYYLMIAEGGTETNHSVTIARSTNVYGPYESDPGNPILTAKGTNQYFQTVGHADLFQDAAGNWWGAALSTRSGPEWEIYPMGRETVLYPAKWEEGEWPILQPVRGTMEGPLPFGGNNKDVNGAGPWVDEGDVIDFEPQSALPFHFVHWRTPPQRSTDYVVSPEGHTNTLGLKASRANLTGDAAFVPGVGGQTFIARVQSHTLFSYSVDVEFEATAPNHEAGISAFLTQDQHIDISIVALPSSNSLAEGSNSLVPHISFHTEASGKPNITVPEPVTVPVPATWIGKPIRLQINAKSDTEYIFTAASSSDPQDVKTLGNANAIILSGGSGPFTGTLLGAFATTNGGNQTFDAYISQWRYTPVAQKVGYGEYISA